MIIKTSLLWKAQSGENIAVFEGYYDMLEDWHDISTVYLDTVQTSHLMIAAERIPSLSIFFHKGRSAVTVLNELSASIIQRDAISFNGIEQPVFKFPSEIFPKTFWINAVRLLDEIDYHWDEVYHAVVDGIKRGIQAGKDGADRIDGLLPAEWAWNYIAALTQ